jgi:hypothetical protein
VCVCVCVRVSKHEHVLKFRAINPNKATPRLARDTNSPNNPNDPNTVNAIRIDARCEINASWLLPEKGPRVQAPRRSNAAGESRGNTANNGPSFKLRRHIHQYLSAWGVRGERRAARKNLHLRGVSLRVACASITFCGAWDCNKRNNLQRPEQSLPFLQDNNQTKASQRKSKKIMIIINIIIIIIIII